MTSSTRRRFVQLSAGALTTVLLPGAGWGADVTPSQVAGPYYPTRKERGVVGGPAGDNDLLVVPGAAEEAVGTSILVTGQVLDREGRPVPAVLVELWQACSAGRYLSHRDHRAQRQRDPGFAYYGVCVADSAGFYAFRTLVPPSYPAGVGAWIRPRHLHFAVRGPGRRSFVTQMYFDDPADPLNEAENLGLHGPDGIIATVPRSKRARLIRAVEAYPPGRVSERLGVAEGEPPWAGFVASKWAHFPLVLDEDLEQS